MSAKIQTVETRRSDAIAFTDAHTANADCTACRYCFLGMLQLKILRP